MECMENSFRRGRVHIGNGSCNGDAVVEVARVSHAKRLATGQIIESQQLRNEELFSDELD